MAACVLHVRITDNVKPVCVYEWLASVLLYAAAEIGEVLVWSGFAKVITYCWSEIASCSNKAAPKKVQV